ncbi:MAG: YbdD/YjiX family protein [Alicyclobacillaceae bacterium]|nr:YbdD/YjiX family protein [Alicyclobacillaceae bacterium]
MKSGVQTWLCKVRSGVKTVFGMPDYEAYLERHQRIHPEKEPLSRQEFYTQYLKHRYESGGPTRCC